MAHHPRCAHWRHLQCHGSCRARGVRRLVFASSHQVSAFIEIGTPVALDAPYRPTGLYGISKAFGETLGRLYAIKFGLSVICLRIAAFQPQPRDHRQLLIWISPRDMAQLTVRTLEAPDDVRFLAVFGCRATIPIHTIERAGTCWATHLRIILSAFSAAARPSGTPGVAERSLPGRRPLRARRFCNRKSAKGAQQVSIAIKRDPVRARPPQRMIGSSAGVRVVRSSAPSFVTTRFSSCTMMRRSA